MTAAVRPPLAFEHRPDAIGAVQGTLIVWKLEVGKLCHQVRVLVAVGCCLIGPFLLDVGLAAQSGVPKDTLFGRWVHTSGFAVPLVVLGFTSQWVFPVLTSLVAGDIFSSEDHLGTWKLILTRSCSRRQVFAGKVAAALTWSVAVLVLLTCSSVVAGLLEGTESLVGLSGQVVSSSSALTLVIESWATLVAPVMVFAALGIALSVLSRSSAVGIGGPVVIGLCLQVLSLVGLPEVVQLVLPVTAAGSWHGLWTDPSFLGPLASGVAVSAVWTLVLIGGAAAVFDRRAVRVA